jgi:hypothetical protein
MLTWIPGTDGKPISYYVDNKNNIIWSRNTKQDTKILGKAMFKTKGGRDAFDNMKNSPIITPIKISSESSNVGRGKTELE